jgi:crotonobetainyl-CoA:carnitine CoA-transferase CaiB-like acyl-CoA transferase
LKERGFLTAQQTEAGMVNLPNSPMRYAGSGLRALVRPPALGEHTEEVLQQLCGLDAAAIADLRGTGTITPSPKTGGH